MSERKYAIIGAGITGLTSAHLLLSLDPDCSVTIFERNIPGGNLQTIKVGGITVDAGPDNFITKKTHAYDLAVELGLKDNLMVPTMGTVEIFNGDSLKKYPAGTYMGIPTDSIELKKAGIVSENSLKKFQKEKKFSKHNGGDVTLGALLTPRFGNEIVDLLIEPIMAGIHAGTVDSLGVAATAPELLAAAVSTGSLTENLKHLLPKKESLNSITEDRLPTFLGISGGMNLLTSKLLDSIIVSNSVSILIGHRVEQISLNNQNHKKQVVIINDNEKSYEFDGAVVATDAKTAVKLFGTIDKGIADELSNIQVASVAMVFFAFEIDNLIDSSQRRGILIPRSLNSMSTAITFLSNKWKSMRDEKTAIIRVAVGGIGNQRHLDITKDELITSTLKELQEILGINLAPHDTQVVYFNNAFTQYGVNHLQLANKIKDQIAALGNIRLASAILGGVGLSDRILAGAKAASELIPKDKLPF